MGTLCKRKGEPDPDQTELYIIAPNPQRSGVATLQVDRLAVELLDLMGYSPQFRGEDKQSAQVEDRLCWAMWDIGMLYTSKSSTSSPGELSDQENIQTVTNQESLNRVLTADRRRALVSCLQNYEGPRQRETKELISQLQNRERAEDTSDQQREEKAVRQSRTANSTSERDNEQATTVDKNELTVETLYERKPPEEDELRLIYQIINSRKRSEVDGDVDIDVSTNDYRRFVLASVRTFADHEYVTSENPVLLKNGDIGYKIAHKAVDPIFYVHDCWESEQCNYRVIIKHPCGSLESVTALLNDELVTHEVYGDVDTGREQVESWLKWVLPSERIEPEIFSDRYVTQLSGEDLSVIAPMSEEASKEDLVVGVVDRISGGGNPVVEMGKQHMILNRGEEGEKLVIQKNQPQRGTVLSKIEGGNHAP